MLHPHWTVESLSSSCHYHSHSLLLLLLIKCFKTKMGFAKIIIHQEGSTMSVVPNYCIQTALFAIVLYTVSLDLLSHKFGVIMLIALLPCWR